MRASEQKAKPLRAAAHDVPNPWGGLLALACFTLIAATIGIGLLEHYLDAPPVYAETIESTRNDATSLAHGAAAVQAAPDLAMARHDDRGPSVANTAQFAAQVEDTLRSTHTNNVPPARVEMRRNDAAFTLAALEVEWSGLDFDRLVEELYPGADVLPLDSTDFRLDAPAPSSTPVPPYTGPLRLAIVVDDGGYGGWITEEILAMPNTLTLSILPHAPYSYDTALRATQLGFEVMLHMPMENVSGRTTYPGEITVTMEADRMLELTEQALADVPGAVGINNHTGSKFTSDAAAMRTWLGLIQDRGYFFIDSRTSRYACAFEIAGEMGFVCAENDLFLDHSGAPNAIRARFKQIVELVKRQGQAIGICHFRKNTVPVLKAMMPEFAKEGIEIVHASALVR
ncbi:MAG: divergent polysaccharide deacetylase family protein [Candidatus Hydrogenedentes bacterium]|nr:divergent polysaccharide deacetylase family protein [Candidatus Hydrogenedentota bacterium]